MKALLLPLLITGLGQVYAQTDPAAPAPARTAPVPAPTVAGPGASVPVQAKVPIPGQVVSDEQKNSSYNQNQTNKEVYQQSQIQAITDKPVVPSTPVTEQAATPAAETPQPQLTPPSPASQELVKVPVEGTVLTATSTGEVISAPLTLAITREQSESPDFPLNVVPEPVRPVLVRAPRVYPVPRFERGPASYEKRTELRSLTPAIPWQKQILDNARAVAIVIEKNKLHAVTDSIYQLDVGITLGQRFKLCPGTPFIDQPVIGLGTAFILARQTMMTAGHVLEEDLSRYVVVFGFEMVNKTGAYEGLISLKDIYYPTRIVQSSETLDVTVFEVSRPLDRPVLKYAKEQLPAVLTPIYMIGHPYGLPKKVALNASVQSNGNAEFFYTSLFAAQGNSGSPVFDFRTNEVVGVLVSGEVDYDWNGGCNAPKICGLPYCKGEKVVSITAIPHIQSLITGEAD